MRALAMMAALAAGWFLTGCDYIRAPEEVRACRAFTQAQLRSPATYSEVSARSFDAPVTEAELEAEYFPDQSRETDRLGMAIARGRPVQLRTVLIEYDADNAYGTPIRGENACAFLLVDGQVPGAGNLEARARTAAAMERAGDLVEQLGDRQLRRQVGRRGTGLPCCVR